MKAIDIARVAHEVNKAYCEFLGDDTQNAWDETPPGIQESVLDGIVAHIENPGLTPQDSHANWKKFREADGWVFGKDKDLQEKTHPNMVAYSKLPKEQKIKDVIFKGVVDSLSSMVINPGVLAQMLQDNLKVLAETKEMLRQIEKRLATPVSTGTGKPSVTKKVHRSLRQVVQRPAGHKGGFAQPSEVVRKAAVTNTNQGSGGKLNMPKRGVAPVAPPVQQKKQGGLVKSGAGDGAAALAMMEQKP